MPDLIIPGQQGQVTVTYCVNPPSIDVQTDPPADIRQVLSVLMNALGATLQTFLQQEQGIVGYSIVGSKPQPKNENHLQETKPDAGKKKDSKD